MEDLEYIIDIINQVNTACSALNVEIRKMLHLQTDLENTNADLTTLKEPRLPRYVVRASIRPGARRSAMENLKEKATKAQTNMIISQTDKLSLFDFTKAIE